MMKLTTQLKSLEKAAIEQEVRIAEMNSRLYELQAELLTRDQSLATIQADLVHCGQALVVSRGTLAEKIRLRHAEKQKFTNSIWWKATSVVRAPMSALKNFRHQHFKDAINSLELLIRSREEKLEVLNVHAAALADLAAQKDRLLADLSTQASQRRLEIAALDHSIEEESHAWDAMRDDLTNSQSWKLTAPFRATAFALTWWRLDAAERAAVRRNMVKRAAARRAKRRGPCRIQPVHQLMANPDGSFTSTGIDPQFSVQHASGSIPRGWVEISFDVLETDAPLYPILYTDADTNFKQAVELPLGLAGIGRKREILRIPRKTSKLRFDPTNREGKFAIGDLRLRKVSRRTVLLELLSKSPHGTLKTLSKVLCKGLEAVWDEVFTYGITSRHKDYSAWLQECDHLSDSDLQKIKEHTARLNRKPLISIIMPTHNTKPEFLKAAIESIQAQIYQHWELCIADDASTDSSVWAILNKYKEKDKRIKVVFRPTNGHVSAASNSALELATGEITALMGHNDLLPVHALYMIAVELNAHPDADLIYSDEDKINEQGLRHGPHFKSDWNFELFCSMNMISHLGVYRTSLLREIGGFREGFEGGQDYDLSLRVIARTTPDRIRHIPFILYHRRILQNSGSSYTGFLDKAADSNHRALVEYFWNIGEEVNITSGHLGYNRVIRSLPPCAPLVSLLIPTRDRVDLLRGCVDGLLNRTDYPNLEILILDNESTEPETHAYFQSLSEDARVRIIKCAGPFNFSTINNFGAEQARGSVIGFINNDIEIIGSEWLREMVVHAIRPNVGAVGAKLLYADGTLQHGGVILGLGGVAGHSHKYASGGDAGYFGRMQIPQYLSAVTAACLLMRRECFDEIGGYDEKNLAVAFNDVDLCLKVRAAGYDIVWTPFAELYHLESASRGTDMAPEKAERFAREVAYMRSRWSEVLDNDPYYNPNLTITSEDFAYAFPSRARRPWLGV